jgi:hypothetical protein
MSALRLRGAMRTFAFVQAKKKLHRCSFINPRSSC